MIDRYHPTEVVYFGSIKKLHFRGFDAYACTCGDTGHEKRPRLELRDEKGRIVLQCVRNTSVQLVPLHYADR